MSPRRRRQRQTRQRTYNVQEADGVFTLALSARAVIEARHPSARHGQVRAVLTVRVDRAVVAEDTVTLTSAKSRAAFLRAVQGIPDAALLALAQAIRQRPPARPNAGPDPDAIPYVATERGLVWLKPVGPAIVETVLTNFTARIARNVVQDDGAERVRALEIEATLNGHAATFTVPATEFGAMNWPMKELGAEAVVHAGLGLRDHARAAIQLLSRDMTTHHVFTHIGWRQIEGAWVYLHAGGALGAHGPVAGIDVAPPSACARYLLPDPPAGDVLVQAVHASLRVLEVAPRRLTVPLLAAISRAVLGGADFSLHLVGATGVFKTALAALLQQYFGAEMDAGHLPAAWSSTANALEGVQFAAKDAIVTVDDFAPAGSQADVERLHHAADRVFRGQGNLSGRLRLRPDILPAPRAGPARADA